MIHQDKGAFVATCNHCGTRRFADCAETFFAFVVEIRAAGWKIDKVEDDGQVEWEHVCPKCEEGATQ